MGGWRYTPEKWTVQCIIRVAHDLMCTIFSGYTSIHRKSITAVPYHLIFNAIKRLKFSLTLILLTLLLLMWLTMYFRFGGWRYTLFVLNNQNHCYMPKSNDKEITQYSYNLRHIRNLHFLAVEG